MSRSTIGTAFNSSLILLALLKTGKPQGIQDGCGWGRHPTHEMVHLHEQTGTDCFPQGSFRLPLTQHSRFQSECPQKQEVKATQFLKVWMQNMHFAMFNY